MDEDGLTVRRPRSGEGGLLRRVRLAALADSPAAFATTLARAQERPDSEWADDAAGERHVVIVALRGAEPVGMAGGRLRDVA